MKNVLITGGAGFIAHHLIYYLLKKTNWNIVSLDRLDYSGNLNRLDNILSQLDEKDKQRVKIVFHDLKSEINPWIENEIGKIDIILHLAAGSHVDRSIDYPMEFVLDNVVGTANILAGIITSIDLYNFGSGLDQFNPPVVVIDEPLNYTDIPLVYSTSSSGVGAEATINVKVGQGSSVIEFEINNFGYAFKKGEILTIPVGGATGIPTNTSLTFEEFQITIQDTYSDNFNGYTPGEFQVLDRIDLWISKT